MVSLSRRKVLVGFGGLALLLGAGASYQEYGSERESPEPTKPPKVRNAAIGASDSFVKAPPADHIDIREHGARVDGSHDDRAAIQSALDEAVVSGTPDAVYLPEGTIRVSDQIHVGGRHSGVTICGTGFGTHLRLDGGHTENTSVFEIHARDDGPLTGLTIRDLRIDCQKEKQPATNIGGITTRESGEGDDGHLVENVWFHDAVGVNCLWRLPGTTLRFISSWGAERWHGMALTTNTDNVDRPIVAEYCRFWGNGTHGIDASAGHTVIRHVLSEENGWGGKNTHLTKSSRWTDAVFRNNDHFGFMTSGSPGSLTMDRVMAEGNGDSGFYIQGGGDLRIGELVALRNGTDSRVGNIFIDDEFSVTADSIRSGSAVNGPGLNIDSEATGVIRAYTHDGQNATGSLENRSRITIESIAQDSVEPLRNPTNPEHVSR